MFPWPPAEFQQHTIDHAEVYQSVAFKYGTLDRLAHRSTFNSKTKNYFAFADYCIPTPLHYFEDYWRQVGMPFGPMHYGSLRSGGKRIREELGIPCGLAMAPTLESNVTLHTLLFAFGARVLDPNGRIAINMGARPIEALKYAKALYQHSGTPQHLNSPPSVNVPPLLTPNTP